MTATLTAIRNELLGYGLITPLRRHAGKDFASGGGDGLIRSQVAQVLMTKPGELPWNPSFGVNLDRYRHRNAAEGLVAVVADEIVEALQAWIPTISIADALVEMGGGLIKVKVVWRVMNRMSPANTVTAGPNVTEVEI